MGNELSSQQQYKEQLKQAINKQFVGEKKDEATQMFESIFKKPFKKVVRKFTEKDMDRNIRKYFAACKNKKNLSQHEHAKEVERAIKNLAQHNFNNDFKALQNFVLHSRAQEMTGLMLLCKGENSRLVDSFLGKFGLEQLDMVTSNGSPCIHFACLSPKSVDLLRVLLEHKADMCAKSMDGFTSLDICRQMGNVTGLKVLERGSMFTGMVNFEHSSPFQAVVGNVLGDMAKTWFKKTVGGYWNSKYVTVTRLEGQKSMVQRFKCPSCKTDLEVVLSSADRKKSSQAVVCVCAHCKKLAKPFQSLKQDTLFEIAFYPNDHTAEADMVYSLKGSSISSSLASISGSAIHLKVRAPVKSWNSHSALDFTVERQWRMKTLRMQFDSKKASNDFKKAMKDPPLKSVDMGGLTSGGMPVGGTSSGGGGTSSGSNVDAQKRGSTKPPSKKKGITPSAPPIQGMLMADIPMAQVIVEDTPSDGVMTATVIQTYNPPEGEFDDEDKSMMRT